MMKKFKIFVAHFEFLGPKGKTLREGYLKQFLKKKFFFGKNGFLQSGAIGFGPKKFSKFHLVPSGQLNQFLAL